MAVMLGGPNARGQRIVRGIVVSYQYVNEEPALVLFPVRKRTESGAFVVCLSAAFKYVDDKYLMQQASQAAQVMGIYATKSELVSIASLLNDSLDDLVKMKPEPEKEKKTYGEGSLETADGKTVEFELTE